VEPQLGIVQQVEGDECHALMLRCTAHVKVVLSVVEPGEGITKAIKFQEFELVGRRWEVTVIVPTLPLARLMQRPRHTLSAMPQPGIYPPRPVHVVVPLALEQRSRA
jgi:hypothetical protein